jgi:hypothetical protein
MASIVLEAINDISPTPGWEPDPDRSRSHEHLSGADHRLPVKKLRYDEERESLWLVDETSGGRIVTYGKNGGSTWQQTGSALLSGVKDFAMTQDNRQYWYPTPQGMAWSPGGFPADHAAEPERCHVQAAACLAVFRLHCLHQ